MQKKITYYVQWYRPAFEAISKEVRLLAEHFSDGYDVKIHDLHLGGLGTVRHSRRITSYHFAFYPILASYAYYLSRMSNLNHIYTSLGDLPYLHVLDLRRTILTAAASCNFGKAKKRVAYLKKLQKIVVESQKQRDELLQLGIPSDKISVVYPPVDLGKFSYTPTKGTFTILFASCPTRFEDFEKRGVHLLLECAKLMPDVQFFFAWRGGAYGEIKQLVANLKNVEIVNELVDDMNEVYARAHCTVVPYTRFDDFLKLIPNSALESLAAGKPVLVSTKTEITSFIRSCGVVFEPDPVELVAAIRKMKKNYAALQKNCRKTAELFSKDRFIAAYEQIYGELL
jgi:glycosyltransferase involved in cell wall biosynthesis